ncbi:MAG: MFS transporter [Coriobacteriia bacterium]|nr:MFS transporter [Coriobacteriia bacterium]
MAAETQTTTKVFTKDFLLIALVNFLTFMSFQLFPSSLPLYAREIGAPEHLLGWLTALTTVSALVTRPVMGAVVDRKGRHGVMIAGLIIMAVSIILMALVPIFGALLALRLLQGVGWGCSTTANSTTASDVIPKPRFAEGMGYYSLSAALALAIAPGLGIQMLNVLGMPVLAGCSTVFLALALVGSFFITFKRISPETAPKKIEFIEPASVFPAVTVFFTSLCYGALVTFLALDAQYRGIEGIPLFFTVYAMATLVSRPVSGMLVDRKGFTPAVVAGIAIMVPSMLLITFASSLGMYLVAAVLLGVGFGTLQSSLSAMAIMLAPPNRRGSANATYLLGFDGGIGVGAVASGVLAGAVGYFGMWLAISVMPLVAAAVYAAGCRNLPQP